MKIALHENAYTPGEWRIGDAGHTVFGPNLGGISPLTVARDLTRGNARLIAAAPEMAELLREVARAFYVDGTAKTLRPLMARIRPLLDKAEGK